VAAEKNLAQLSVASLKGVGPALQQRLAALGIHSVQDLLFHLPLRYEDRTRITPIGALQPNESAVIEGEVRACDIVFGRRRSLVCRLQDGTGTVTLRFYHFNAAQKNQLAVGARLHCYGETRRGSSGLELYHPEYRIVQDDEPLVLQQALTPVYPSTEGFSQLAWRKLLPLALAKLNENELADYLPAQVNKLAKISLANALRYLHQPPVNAPLDKIELGQHPAQQRLAFEELIAHQLSLLRLRDKTRERQAPKLSAKVAASLEQQFLAALPFPLTNAQQAVLKEINTDLSGAAAMLRLVQGDVGSGKTVVAALAALRAIANGYQVAVMAPTELLAEQHLLNFQRWLEPLTISVELFSGRIKGKAREKNLQRLRDGEIRLAVGTHALFQDEVQFQQLGLIIIDEQHRFGVHQRLSLLHKGGDATQLQPHQLVMTATPIPRTLAMSAYADLDTSIIDELPPGRTPVQTVVIADNRRPAVIERLRAACQNGAQAYWVCTLIEESDQLEAQAAEATWQTLTEALPELRLGLVHGRLKPAEKAAVMAAFKAAELDVLVATTVIEVGVDVPNASLMIIENPERLGLAQLHQLRGRVGRGSAASYCVLLHGASVSRLGRERLAAMRDLADGFAIAEKDLELRGPGEVLGTRQTGLMQMRIADLQRDSELLPAVREATEYLLKHQADSVEPLIRRWLAEGERYAAV
jgi:ATP-dependent DNA helicase RecG